MPSRQYIVTNFAYGTGPYLHTTELAIAFNDELERRGRERSAIIVPLVYGERQRAVMREEFASFLRARPEEIVLDENLGMMLREIFYDGTADYAVSLARWIERVRDTAARAHEHLSGTFAVHAFDGTERVVDGRQIIIEMSRSPRLRFDIAPAYSTTFGFLSDIFTRALREPPGAIAIPADVLQQGIESAEWVEQGQRMHAVGFPGTFTPLENAARQAAGSSGSIHTRDSMPCVSSLTGFTGDLPPTTYHLQPTTFLTPPLTSQQPKTAAPLEKPGILVTVTGIAGLERLYTEATDLGLAIYSTTEGVPPGSMRMPPDVIVDSNIVFQFARAGWGSIWLSLTTGVPIVVPAFDPVDDPEIYFNNKMIERLGIGIVYRGEPLSELTGRLPSVCVAMETLRTCIFERWGTLDGHSVSAARFVEDFLRSDGGVQ
ncbi:MAG: hypothetical protein Q8R39_03160 [bacterium]|nr:hypothetical protein [bacterium]MDZ4285094.1 hypothetical protein [Patescibacteria group bacterium]